MGKKIEKQNCVVFMCDKCKNQENNYLSKFNICIDLGSTEISGNLSSGLKGTGTGSLGSERVKNWIDRRDSGEYLPSPAELCIICTEQLE